LLSYFSREKSCDFMDHVSFLTLKVKNICRTAMQIPLQRSGTCRVVQEECWWCLRDHRGIAWWSIFLYFPRKVAPLHHPPGTFLYVHWGIWSVST
jgi:hypothetical protein